MNILKEPQVGLCGVQELRALLILDSDGGERKQQQRVGCREQGFRNLIHWFLFEVPVIASAVGPSIQKRLFQIGPHLEALRR